MVRDGEPRLDGATQRRSAARSGGATQGDEVRADGGTRAGVRITVLGVDPADPRAVAELTRWVPDDATVLYRAPALARRAAADRTLRTNPPGALFAFVRRLRGRNAEPGALAAAVDAAASEGSVPVVELQCEDAGAGASVDPWWRAGAWIATGLGLAASVAAIALVLLVGELLVTALAILLVTAAIALPIGVGYAREAAAIRRDDAAVAAAIEAQVDPGERGRPVVVVPARNAAGVAATLRERGIEAEAYRTDVGAAPSPGL